MRAARVQHQRDAGGGEVAALAGDLLGELLGELAVDVGEVDAGLLEDAALGQHARPPAAAALRAARGPRGSGRAVELLQGGADAVLQVAEVLGGAAAKVVRHRDTRSGQRGTADEGERLAV